MYAPFLFYNLPISLLPTSHTFQQAKFLKARKIVNDTAICVSKTTYPFSDIRLAKIL